MVPIQKVRQNLEKISPNKPGVKPEYKDINNIIDTKKTPPEIELKEPHFFIKYNSHLFITSDRFIFSKVADFQPATLLCH